MQVLGIWKGVLPGCVPVAWEVSAETRQLWFCTKMQPSAVSKPSLQPCEGCSDCRQAFPHLFLQFP